MTIARVIATPTPRGWYEYLSGNTPICKVPNHLRLAVRRSVEEKTQRIEYKPPQPEKGCAR